MNKHPSLISGPRLDRLVEALTIKAAEYRQKQMAALETGYPYGAVKLTPQEQISNFISMAPQDYEALVIKLNEKYRGLPNAYNLVNKDLAQFVRRMLTLMLSRGQLSDQDFNTQYQQVYSDLGVQ